MFPSHRNIWSGLALALLFAPACAWWGAEIWNNCYWEERFEERLAQDMPRENLQHFSLGREEYQQLKWEKPYEFIWQGGRYDLVIQDTIEGFIHLWCFSDQAEQAAKQKLRDLWERQNPCPQKHQEAVNQFWKGFYTTFPALGNENLPIASAAFPPNALSPLFRPHRPEVPPPRGS